jgi:hypothetical protein
MVLLLLRALSWPVVLGTGTLLVLSKTMIAFGCAMNIGIRSANVDAVMTPRLNFASNTKWASSMLGVALNDDQKGAPSNILVYQS